MTSRSKRCPDCQVLPGQAHEQGCDVEHCSVCGGQRLMCGVFGGDGCPGHNPALMVWTGEWPGKLACREFGWWVLDTDHGLIPVPVDTPGAREDLNRWSLWYQAKHRGWVP